MAIFEQTVKINISQVGPSALITNMGMLSILEEVACRHSDVAGFGILDIPVNHLSWVLLAWKVNILRRVPYGTILRVCTWAKSASKFNTYRDFEVYDENNNIVCQATSKWTLIDTQKGSITRITDDIINQYHPDDKNVFEDPEISKLIEPQSSSNTYIYQTQRRDIDVNKHMHNLNYLYLAYETLPEEIYFSEECNHIEIMYKKGIKLSDIVKCSYTYEENVHYITLKSEDGKSLHAIIKLH